MLILLVPSPRARLQGLGEAIWSRAATWCSWTQGLFIEDLVVDINRRCEPNRARTEKARAHCEEKRVFPARRKMEHPRGH